MRPYRSKPTKSRVTRARQTRVSAWHKHLSSARKQIVESYGSKELYQVMMFETGCRFVEGMYHPDEDSYRENINAWISDDSLGFWTFWENEWRNWEAILVARFKKDPLWVVSNAQHSYRAYIDKHFEEALTCQRTKDSFGNWLKYITK